MYVYIYTYIYIYINIYMYNIAYSIKLLYYNVTCKVSQILFF